MSQTTQQRNRGGRPGERPRRPRRERVEPEWIPKTILGKKVASGEITEIGFVGLIVPLHILLRIFLCSSHFLGGLLTPSNSWTFFPSKRIWYETSEFAFVKRTKSPSPIFFSLLQPKNRATKKKSNKIFLK